MYTVLVVVAAVVVVVGVAVVVVGVGVGVVRYPSSSGMNTFLHDRRPNGLTAAKTLRRAFSCRGHGPARKKKEVPGIPAVGWRRQKAHRGGALDKTEARVLGGEGRRRTERGATLVTMQSRI